LSLPAPCWMGTCERARTPRASVRPSSPGITKSSSQVDRPVERLGASHRRRPRRRSPLPPKHFRSISRSRRSSSSTSMFGLSIARPSHAIRRQVSVRPRRPVAVWPAACPHDHPEGRRWPAPATRCCVEQCSKPSPQSPAPGAPKKLLRRQRRERRRNEALGGCDDEVDSAGAGRPRARIDAPSSAQRK
jgi:hypothetical protein